VEEASKKQGMRNFLLIWVGQVFSLIGSSITNFALGIWAWEKTGQATPLALTHLFYMLPMMLLSPLAGVWVDRWNRKLVMAISDTLAGIGTLMMLVMLSIGRLELWHLYLAAVLNGIGGAFQWPAYSAAISMMVPKHQYTRANGLISLAESGTSILAPLLGALMISTIGLNRIFIVDLITLAVALLCLLIVKVPNPSKKTVGRDVTASFWQELGFGFRFIFERKPLLYLQLGFFLINLVASIAGPLYVPIILAKSGNNATLLGYVQSISAVGGLLGGLTLTAWGGHKRKSKTVVLGWTVTGVFAMLFGLAKSPFMWIVAQFMEVFSIPILNGANQAIWMAKVDPAVQGRVFSIRRLVAQVSIPLALLISGPLADKVFEPAFKTGDNWLAAVFKPLVGLGPGSGMAAIMLMTGGVGLLVSLAGWMNPLVRNVETLLPDHDEASL